MKIISLSDFRDSLWKLCILPRGVREKSSIVVNVDFILCQPDNWALNKTTGTGYSGFVGLKNDISVRFFFIVQVLIKLSVGKVVKIFPPRA